jgi:hypothetical protein
MFQTLFTVESGFQSRIWYSVGNIYIGDGRRGRGRELETKITKVMEMIE